MKRSHIGLVIAVSLVLGVVAWGLYGSSFHGGVPRPGGLVVLRWCWPLLVAFAVPLTWATYKLRKAERRVQILENTLDVIESIEAAKARLATADALAKPSPEKTTP